jgi:hypothetical protein
MPVEAKIGLASCRNGQGGTSESRRTTGAIRAAGRYAADQTRTALAGLVPGGWALIEPLLVVRRVLREQIAILHRRLLTSGETRQSGKFSMSSLMRALNLTAPTTRRP